MPIPVVVQHAGKRYDLELDTSLPPIELKNSIHQLTGVPPHKQKVLLKGGQLKDDTNWSKLGIKAGHVFMVLGTAGEVPKAPSTPVIFMEDMTDLELANVTTFPAGLVNLGNTCYLNSTLQVLRAIPEYQTALDKFTSSTPSSSSTSTNAIANASGNTNVHGQLGGGGGGKELTLAMKEMYSSLRSAGDQPILPVKLLEQLRRVAPQFAERSTATRGFAQQDAEECWVQIVGATRPNVAVCNNDDESGGAKGSFVEKWMMGEFATATQCTEAQDEASTVSMEPFLELKCPISINTNYMLSGIKDSLVGQTIEKQSSSLGRNALYSQTCQISRLPAYLTVHMIRFFWRREIAMKTKIMRKVKFPFELDVLELCTPELKEKLVPVARKLADVNKDRRERLKILKRKKTVAGGEDEKGGQSTTSGSRVTPSSSINGQVDSSGKPEVVREANVEKMAVEGETEESEAVIRARESAMLQALVHADVKSDIGASTSGQYELIGIVTHKGAHADGGHYLGWVRADVLTVSKPQTSTTNGVGFEDPDKIEWYKFDDDKVSTVPQEKIKLLDGGGEDSSAYILLYKSMAL